MKVYRISNKLFGHLYISGLFLCFILYASDYILHSEWPPFRPSEIGGMALACFIVSIPIYYICSFVYSVRISNDLICGYKSSGFRARCNWNEIAHAKIRTVFFIKYIYLYNENNKQLMILPHKWMAKQEEFEEEIRDILPSDHPLRKLC